MPLLSDILAAEAPEAVVFGVEVDEESFSPPPSLKEVSFIYREQDGDIDEALMDVIISYGLAGVEIVLEIPGDAPGIDAKYLVSVAANAGFSLAIMPPENDTVEAREAYYTTLEAFARAYLAQPNYAKFLSPVTNYLEYLFIEVLRGDNVEFTTRDPFIQERFIARMSPEFVDAFKERLRLVIYEAFGDRGQFETFAWGMVKKIHGLAEANCQDIKNDPSKFNLPAADGDAGRAGNA